MRSRQYLDQLNARIRDVRNAETSNIVELVRIAGLDPALAFRHMNLEGVDFSGCDLSGYDFRGARLTGAIFTSAFIGQAVFDADQLSGEQLMSAIDSVGSVLLHEGGATDNHPGLRANGVAAGAYVYPIRLCFDCFSTVFQRWFWLSEQHDAAGEVEIRRV